MTDWSKLAVIDQPERKNIKRKGLTAEEKAARRLRARHRFRAIVRLTIENLYWLDDSDMTISDNVTRNIQLITRKKIKKCDLTIEEKSILNKQKEYRTDEEKKILNRAIGGLRCFRRYPSVVKRQLAAVTYFCFFGPGRAIVKQYHKPMAMYFVMSGEANVIVKRFDKVLEEWVEEITGVITAGTMFGEVALLHGINRLATIVTNTPCEFLMIKKEDFDLVLRATVLKAWEEIQKIMNKFTYFKNWDNVTKTECSILSRTKSYDSDEIILGDGYGMNNCVYFVTKGSCYIVEHMKVQVVNDKGIKRYRIHIPKEEEAKTEKEVRLSGILNKYLRFATQGDDETLDSAGEMVQVPDEPQSIVSVETAENAKESDEYLSCDPPKVFDGKTHFIKVCEFTVGACFNIGENFARRRVVAKVPTNCLLVPRYWIMKNNKDNIWNMVQQFLNQEIPNSQKLFKRYIEEQKFKKYRKSLIKDLLAQKKVSNNNSIHNVPYSIRLKEGTDVDYH